MLIFVKLICVTFETFVCSELFIISLLDFISFLSIYIHTYIYLLLPTHIHPLTPISNQRTDANKLVPSARNVCACRKDLLSASNQKHLLLIPVFYVPGSF